MTPTKVLITGATGFIGTRLCERFTLLPRQQVAFRALVHSYNRACRIARLQAEMAGGDLLQPATIEAALRGCDCVIHLAHAMDETARQETANLVQACLRAGLKRFVHISSMSVHGPAPGPACAQESTAVIGRYDNTYCNAKAEAEEVVQQAIRKHAFPAVILRPTVVYGPYSPFVQAVVDRARRGEISLIDDGRGLCNAVFVDDVCAAIHCALHSDQGVGQAFFVNADQAVTWKDFNLVFGQMVTPAPAVRNYASAEALAHWASLKPTLKSNAQALARLAISPDLHRQLGTVPMVGSTIRWAKGRLKACLSPERVAALKGKGGARTRAGGGAPVRWPEEGRIRRELFPIAFSNQKAREVLGWKPAYDLAKGAALTRQWLEFTRALSGA